MSDSGRSRNSRLRWALRFVRPRSSALGVILVLSLGTAAVNAVEPLVLKMVFDDLDTGSTGVLVEGVLILGGLVLVRECVGFVSNWMTWRTRLGLHFSILREAVDQLHRLPVSYHQQRGVGSTMTRLDRGIQGFLSAFNQIAFQSVPALVYLALSLVFMIRLDARLALVVLALSPVPAVIAGAAGPRQARRERRLLDRWSEIYARFNEVLSGIATVKSFTREDEERRRFLRDVRDANHLVERGVGFDGAVRGGQNLVVGAARAVALGYGGYLVVSGDITSGTLVAFLGYVAGLFGPVKGLTSIYETAQKATASLDTLHALLEAPEEVKDADDAVALSRVRGAVEFRALRFAYCDGEEVLRGIDLAVAPGETVAIVGPSGSGKTTLMSLLQRFWDPTGGRILVDDRDIRLVTQRSLRRNVGVVHQDALLFKDTIEANIAYGHPHATPRAISEAARNANAHEFILRLPDGYETIVGERGVGLSGGQRQRLAIARALLKDPPILVLDEATSALDAESEALVQGALEKLSRHRTTFVIAHRLSTVVAADRIVVLREGRVEESGTHDQLLARGGYYASLVRRQLGHRLLVQEE